jgi:hypothetical protein
MTEAPARHLTPLALEAHARDGVIPEVEPGC